MVASISGEHRKTGAICFSEKLIVVYKATRHHNPDDHNPDFRLHEKLKSHIYMLTEFYRKKAFRTARQFSEP
jgi:hypothetical protein